MGDWNVILSEGKDGREVGKYGLGQRNARGNRLVEFSKKKTVSRIRIHYSKNTREDETHWKFPAIQEDTRLTIS